VSHIRTDADTVAFEQTFGVRLLAPLPILGGLPQDEILVRVGHADAVTLIRFLPPNYGAISDALATGTAFSLNTHQRAEDLIALLTRLGASDGSHLRRLK
jgi:hypothetical protein